jgi:hypothetical protein
MSKTKKLMSEYQKLIEKLNINEKFTKVITKDIKKFNEVKENLPLIEHYNMACDLLFLPTTKLSYKYLFVIIDLANDEFDMEPIKSKESSVIVSSMKTIFKRKYLDLPYASMTNDDGTEFKGEFHKYLVNNDILHKIALPGRHKSNPNVESLNRQLGRFLNGYMNSQEVQTGKPYKEWTDIIDTLRKELNKIRVKSLPKNPRTHEYKILDTLTTTPKYKVNDMVYRALDEPRNSLNEKQSGKFREGDNRWDEVPRRITKVLYYSGSVAYRYMLNGIHQASYSEWELMPTPEDVTEDVAEIKAVLDRQYH